MSIEINNKRYFHLFWHSDEHTLHPNTPTQHILNNISTVRKEAGVETMDMEVWGGDLTHDITQTSNLDFIYLQHWIKQYLFDCHQRKRIVRILAGTFSHDRNQPELFEILKPKGSEYIKYVDKLSIEYIKEFGIHILYVPDNFGRKSKVEIYDEALALIASHGLKKVDFIFLHGGFDFQLPILKDHPNEVYDSNAWSKLASKVILSGHIHTPSHRLNIYSSGSIDRLQHGEMHPKGAYNVFFNKEDVICKFIENKNAMIYDDIKITPETEEKEIHQLLDRYLEKVPMKGASIKIKGGLGEIVNPIIQEYTLAYPEYQFHSANAVEHGVMIDETLYEPERYTGVVLDEKNLGDNILKFKEKQKKIPPWFDKKDFDFYLKELMGNVK